MKHLLPSSGAFACILVVCLAVPARAQTRVVAYVPNWIDLPAFAETIDYAKLTHINVAFENPTNDDGDVSFSKRNEPLIAKARASGVKVLVSIGGGAASGNKALTDRYFRLLADDRRRAAFAARLADYVTAHRFDGLDVDIEGPAINKDYGPFIADLAKAFAPKKLLLTAALSKGYGGNNVPDAALAHFDFVNVMAYDGAGPWNPKAPGQHSSLDFAKSNVQYWLDRGLARDRAVLGVPFYGYGFGKAFRKRDYAYKDILARHPGAENTDQTGSTIWYNGLAHDPRQVPIRRRPTPWRRHDLVPRLRREGRPLPALCHPPDPHRRPPRNTPVGSAVRGVPSDHTTHAGTAHLAPPTLPDYPPPLPMDHPTPRRSPFADKLAPFADFTFPDAAAFTHRGHWASFFHDRVGPAFSGRVVFEVGCADADSLARIAARHPTTAFVGLDWKYRALHAGAARVAELGLRNVALLRARAQDIARIFAEREVDEIWVFHPDPCDRDVELKNRLIAEPFLLDAHRVLRDDASLLALKTDHPGYYQWTLALFGLPAPAWFSPDHPVTPATPRTRRRDLMSSDALPAPRTAIRQRFAVAANSHDYWNDPTALAHTAPRPFADEVTFFESRFRKKRLPIYYIEIKKC